MRRDFDFVTMEDYQSDMKESADHAVRAISFVRQQSEQHKRLAMEAIIAAGGSVKIDAYDLHRPDPSYKTEFWRNEADGTITVKVERERR